jgi:hypothetical protein
MSLRVAVGSEASREKLFASIDRAAVGSGAGASGWGKASLARVWEVRIQFPPAEYTSSG